MSKKKHGILQNQLMLNILAVFKQDPYTGMNYKQVAGKLSINGSKEREHIRFYLAKLVEQSFLLENRRGKYTLNPDVYKEEGTSYTTGTVDMKQTGKAYVQCQDQGDDIFIAANNTGQALHGDKVKLRLFPKRKGKKTEGEIIEIIERNRVRFVGIIQSSRHMMFVIPDDNRVHVDFMVMPEDAANAKNGEKVVVELLDWPSKSRNPLAKIVQILGQPGEHEVEMNSILANYDFPLSFPASVIQEANHFPTQIPEKEIQNRADFRDVFTITIDPHDAKDFDDALSLRKISDDLWEVGVHIADVSYYIKADSEIEKEAYRRATSVYLVDRVIPMLPERLSNDLCSLRPNEDRLCYSAIFEMDSTAKVHKYKVCKSIIHSNRRFNYEEVQQIIEKKAQEYDKEIEKLHLLAQSLRKERFKHGAINFHSSEVKFILDNQGKPIDIYIKESLDSNHLVEEFMLLANKYVAMHIGLKADKKENTKTFVYRIHDEPSPEKLNTFSEFLKKLGYQTNFTSRKNISTSMNGLFEKISGKAEETMIETIAIRTMAKAHYSTKNIGHYGLSFKHYTHFTSPIRRYPDLMVHRLLEFYEKGGASVNQAEYEEKCEHSSNMERKATDAERDSVKYKQVEYMADKIGKVFPGTISGVTKWGFYVEIEGTKCEGMVRLADMKDDFYYLDEDNYMVLGHRSKACYRLGDQIEIKVKRIDLTRKQMDFELA